MPMDSSQQAKSLLAPIRTAMRDFDSEPVRAALRCAISSDARICMPHPLGILQGPDALYDEVYAPLFFAFPDLERRDYIVISGVSDHQQWVGCAGCYMGTFTNHWLDIPSTGHIAQMRFHEFYRIENNKVVEVQALWDIPEVMMQADAWPMAPSLGKEWNVPAPATQDALRTEPYCGPQSEQSLQHVLNMLTAMVRYPSQGGPEVMELEKYWHPRFNWYGPAGIGSGRGIAGFRRWHQIPFLNAMPDRGQHDDQVNFHFFADGNYVAVTGWPNMMQTISDDGWMGIAPTNTTINLKSLDFWRLENNLIRENWVLVDLLDVYRQVGVDVFSRLKEFNKARTGFDPETGVSLQQLPARE